MGVQSNVNGKICIRKYQNRKNGIESIQLSDVHFRNAKSLTWMHVCSFMRQLRFADGSFIVYLMRKCRCLAGLEPLWFRAYWLFSLAAFMMFNWTFVCFGGKHDPSIVCPHQCCLFFTVMTCFRCPTVPGRLLSSGRRMWLWSVGVSWPVWDWMWPSWFAPFCCEDSTRTWPTVREITWRRTGSNSSGSLFRPRLVHVCG